MQVTYDPNKSCYFDHGKNMNNPYWSPMPVQNGIDIWYLLSVSVTLSQHFVSLKHCAILPFRIRRATSIPLGKGTKFALHHRKMSTTKRCTIQILHISTFQFTFKCGYNNFISKYTDINSLHVTQINLLHNNTCCST